MLWWTGVEKGRGRGWRREVMKMLERRCCVLLLELLSRWLAGWLARASFHNSPLLETLRSPAAAAAAACLHWSRLHCGRPGWLDCVWRSDTGDCARRRHSLSSRHRQRLLALASSLAAAADMRMRALSSCYGLGEGPHLYLNAMAVAHWRCCVRVRRLSIHGRRGSSRRVLR